MRKLILLGIFAALQVTAFSNSSSVITQLIFSSPDDPVFQAYVAYNTTTNIDFSSEAVSPIFQAIYNKFETERTYYTSIQFYSTGDPTSSTNMTAKFYKVGDYSTEQYGINITVSNNATSPPSMSQESFYFKCKGFANHGEFLCIPWDCANDIVIPTPPPSQTCEDNYYLSQELIKYTFYGTKNMTATQDIINCYQQTSQNSTDTVDPSSACFYAGFLPANMVSLSQLSQNLINAGYTDNGDGTFTQTSVTSS